MSTITVTRVRPIRPRPTIPARRARAAQLRLTRRGRLALFGLVCAMLVALTVALGPSVSASVHSGDPVPVRTVTVKAGDTLWGIATAAAPNGDTRAMVHRIAELNSLPDTGSLQIGQTLAVPTS
ncbi:MAG: LysM peptidoglycan-binding domain-containing protein [Nocardioidaceae bacterium]